MDAPLVRTAHAQPSIFDLFLASQAPWYRCGATPVSFRCGRVTVRLRSTYVPAPPALPTKTRSWRGVEVEMEVMALEKLSE